MEAIELEDFHEDILVKAMRGRGIGKREIAKRIGVHASVVDKVLEGLNDPVVIKSMGHELDLDVSKLLVSADKTWLPKEKVFPNFKQFNLPYGSMRVNIYLIWDSVTKESWLFDAGPDHEIIIEFLNRNKLSLVGIFLTHTHPDHVACLDLLSEHFAETPVYVHELEMIEGAHSINEGFCLTNGALSLESFHTHGHSIGGTTYRISGLEHNLAVVGDAIFAGSMGGGMVSYANALKTNRDRILSLPDDTILCPGHGPMTSVGEEKLANPFFPEFDIT